MSLLHKAGVPTRLKQAVLQHPKFARHQPTTTLLDVSSRRGYTTDIQRNQAQQNAMFNGGYQQQGVMMGGQQQPPTALRQQQFNNQYNQQFQHQQQHHAPYQSNFSYQVKETPIIEREITNATPKPIGYARHLFFTKPAPNAKLATTPLLRDPAPDTALAQKWAFRSIKELTSQRAVRWANASWAYKQHLERALANNKWVRPERHYGKWLMLDLDRVRYLQQCYPGYTIDQKQYFNFHTDNALEKLRGSKLITAKRPFKVVWVLGTAPPGYGMGHYGYSKYRQYRAKKNFVKRQVMSRKKARARHNARLRVKAARNRIQRLMNNRKLRSTRAVQRKTAARHAQGSRAKNKGFASQKLQSHHKKMQSRKMAEAQTQRMSATNSTTSNRATKVTPATKTSSTPSAPKSIASSSTVRSASSASHGAARTGAGSQRSSSRGGGGRRR